MTKVLSISTDRNIFDPESAVRARAIEYGTLFEETHIVVFAIRDLGYGPKKISEKVWIYPTESFNKFTHVFAARIKTEEIIRERSLGVGNTVITSQDPFETGLAGHKIVSKYGFKFNIQVHTDLFSRYFTSSSILNWIRVKIAKRLLPKADSIRVVSERIKNSLVNYKSKITVLPILVDEEKISLSKPIFDLHKKYPQFDFIILMASRLEREKNISIAIEAFTEVLKKYPKTGLVIVGDGGQKNLLKLKAISCKLKASVIFEGWQKDLQSYYKTADLFLNTSLYEGYGMALVEAIASRLPIVTSDVGIVGEILRDGENSSVCSPKDALCFAEKICSIIQDRAIGNKFKQDAYIAMMKDHISKEKYLGEYKKIFDV